MDVLFKRIAAVLAGVVALFFLLLQGVYWYGAYDLPKSLPGPRQEYPGHARALLWAQHGGQGEIRIRRLSSIGMPLAGLGHGLRCLLVWKMSNADTGHDAACMDPPDARVLKVAASDISFSLIAAAEPSRIAKDGVGNAEALRRYSNRWWFMEMSIAIRLSQEWPAERIVDSILDSASLGLQAKGLEHAAQFYFERPAAQLTPSETAALLVISMSASYYDPACKPDNFRRAYVRLMLKTDYTFNLRDPDADLTRMKRPACTRKY